ncbi:hypothetical protein AU476_01165 [Cupriavidus sp. UYMSc13B]|nr:hypothetical protein AU476_01165 [Cupriavidus sp. UYMSc13B]
MPNEQVIAVHNCQVAAWLAQATEASRLAQHKSESGEGELARALSGWSARMKGAAHASPSEAEAVILAPIAETRSELRRLLQLGRR